MAQAMLEPAPDGVIVAVRVVPRASPAGPVGVRDGAMLVRLASPPVDGAANDELIALLARLLGVPRRAVTIVSGARSRTKRVKVAGVTFRDVASRLPH